MSADHNKIIIDDPEEAQWALASHDLAKFIGNVLVRAYPKRRWFVHADCRQGIVDIQLADVTMRMGYTLKLGHKTFFTLQEEAKRAGGEILERYGLSRERAFNRDSVHALRRDHRGDAIPV